jgi:crossover junction endodeoxyribonuclease RusA
MITLPWPPSVNRMWRSVRGRNILSQEGRQYRENGLTVVAAQSPRHWPAEVRLSVSISVYPPDRRRRDLDNMPKAVLDLLTHAGVYVDDSQIDRLEIVRRENHPGGRVTVELRAI